MELAASALSGAMRVGLQIVSSYRGPHLEVYYQLINEVGPEQEFTSPPAIRGGTPHVHKTRFQQTHIQFQLINVGGQRAENIRLTRSGTFERSGGRDFGGLFQTTLPQMPPGQTLQLFLLDTHEIERVEEGKVIGFKADELIITAEYDSPPGVVNTLMTVPQRIKGGAHHRTVFRFSPKLVMGDLPPPRYA